MGNVIIIMAAIKSYIQSLSSDTPTNISMFNNRQPHRKVKSGTKLKRWKIGRFKNMCIGLKMTLLGAIEALLDGALALVFA